MTYTWWDTAKDFLGAVGPALIAIPWFREFFIRLRRAQVSTVLSVGKLDHLKNELERFLRWKVEHPRARDFGWTVLGLACITGSFIIAFIRGLSGLF
jgi:hypothetical protein